MRPILTASLIIATAWCVSPGEPALADGEVAKELAELEGRLDATKLDWQEAYKAFRPEYEAFAKKHAGTEEALTAKLRVLKLLFVKENEPAERVAAGAVLDEILAEYPLSPQLAVLPAMSYYFTEEKFAELIRKLDGPEQPDQVKAALALFHAREHVERKELDKARPYLDLLLGKYKDVLVGYTICGEIADALRSPHPESALAIGATAPEIVGKDIDGNPLKLSDFKGSVVVIDFFGDW